MYTDLHVQSETTYKREGGVREAHTIHASGTIKQYVKIYKINQ